MEFIESNGFEIHFELNKSEHSVRTLTLNRSNAELLRLFNYVARQYDVQIDIETIAYTEGGFRQIWKFLGDNGIQITVIAAIISLLLQIFPLENSEIKQLEKQNLILTNEKLQLEIEKMKSELNKGGVVTKSNEIIDLPNSEIAKKLNETGIIQTIANQPHVLKAKSNFYKVLDGDKEIQFIESAILKDNIKITKPIKIESDYFADYIKSKEELPEEIDKEAEIKIISPVLENIKYKWSGEYKGERIDFFLNDKEFKKSIEMNEISFSHGDVIECDLAIRKRLTEFGEVEITSYAVITVYKRINSSSIVETRHGKIKKRTEVEYESQKELGL